MSLINFFAFLCGSVYAVSMLGVFASKNQYVKNTNSGEVGYGFLNFQEKIRGIRKKAAHFYYAEERNKFTIGSVTLRSIALQKHVLFSVLLQ